MSDDDMKLRRGSKAMLEAIVEQFLSIALVHPDKPPKTQRGERENQVMIIGYNRAQEDLRAYLEQQGFPGLAAVRSPKQQKPMDLGGTRVWQAS